MSSIIPTRSRPTLLHSPNFSTTSSDDKPSFARVLTIGMRIAYNIISLSRQKVNFLFDFQLQFSNSRDEDGPKEGQEYHSSSPLPSLVPSKRDKNAKKLIGGACSREISLESFAFAEEQRFFPKTFQRE